MTQQKTFQNENSIDRLIRFLIGEIALIIAYFWLSGTIQIVFYVIGIVSFLTGIVGFCGFYNIIKFNSLKQCPKPLSKKMIYILSVLLIIIFIAGSYTSDFLTRKIFLEDYNRMNNYYKQTLFQTGKNNREESIKNYEGLAPEYKKFHDKYSKFHPQAFKHDQQADADLTLVGEKIINAKEKIYSGDLITLHKELEDIRAIFQNFLKRNNFSMLAVYLVDFHDSMEKVLDMANTKNSDGVISTYTEADEKLKEVENVANDEEIQIIRKNLDILLNLAKTNKIEELSKQATELKNSFVKVYLKRG